jgi:threonine aldolase
MMQQLDFRSDTVTHPTPAMRQAMANAPLGDDVYGEDPTVNALETKAAAMLGKEAGLFVASGTMGNIASCLAHANRGEEAILGEDAHIYLWETGSLASLGGIVPHTLPTDELGRMDLTRVAEAVRGSDDHHPETKLICVENSYGAKNGMPVPLAYFAGIRQIADTHNLVVHMDGARLFNAATALGAPVADVVANVDSVSFCLSKGLCAPVGSIICGSRDFIRKARRVRKSLGGGMRQAGVLAAAGLIALDEIVPRLNEDHVRAQRLAQGLATIEGVVIDPACIQTNIVMFQLTKDVALQAWEVRKLVKENAGILLGSNGKNGFRACTHYWINDEAVDLLLSTLEEILRKT